METLTLAGLYAGAGALGIFAGRTLRHGAEGVGDYLAGSGYCTGGYNTYPEGGLLDSVFSSVNTGWANDAIATHEWSVATCTAIDRWSVNLHQDSHIAPQVLAATDIASTLLSVLVKKVGGMAQFSVDPVHPIGNYLSKLTTVYSNLRQTGASTVSALYDTTATALLMTPYEAMTNVDVATGQSLGLTEMERAEMAADWTANACFATAAGIEISGGLYAKVSQLARRTGIGVAATLDEGLIDELANQRVRASVLDAGVRSDLAAAEANIGDVPEGKTVAANKTGQRTRSGWSNSAGFLSGPELVEKVMEKAKEIGFQIKEHIFDNGVLGRFYASHAEPQLSLLSDRFAVSRPMCFECRRFLSARAVAEGKTFVVMDPQRVWVFSGNSTSFTIR